MLILLGICFVLLGVFFCKFCDRRSLYLTWKYPKLQSYTYFPLFGHLGFLKYVKIKPKDVEEFFKTATSEPGKMIFCLGYKLLVIHKAEHMEILLTHPNTQNKSYVYTFLNDAMEDSLLCLNGKEWKTRRKAMGPLMQTNVIKSYVEEIGCYAERLAENFKSKCGVYFDANPDIAKSSLDMFTNVAIGIDTNVSKIGEEFILHTQNATRCMTNRCMAVLKHFDFLYKWTKEYKLMKQSCQFGDDVVSNMIVQRKSNFNQTELGETYSDDDDSKKRLKIIDHLINLNLPEQAVKHETILYMAAGYETSSITIAFALLSMAIHPEIQERAYKEVIDVLGTDRSVQHSDLPQFVYLRKVVKETMRLFPAISVVSRVSTGEIQLDDNIVPKNTLFLLSIYDTQRSPLYWPNPLKFDPERFNPEEEKTHHHFSFIPFLAGSRTCFGAPFAWLNIITTLAILLRRFQWFTTYKSIEEIELEIGMTTKCANGITLRAEKRLE